MKRNSGVTCLTTSHSVIFGLQLDLSSNNFDIDATAEVSQISMCPWVAIATSALAQCGNTRIAVLAESLVQCQTFTKRSSEMRVKSLACLSCTGLADEVVVTMSATDASMALQR